MARNRPDIVDNQKASSHPLKAGRIFTANVTAVNGSGQISVSIPAIGSTYGPITPIGTTTLNKYSVGDVVKCSFTDEFFNEIMVYGSAKIKADVYASKVLFEQLQATVSALQTQVANLQSQLNSHSH
jgi:hypothetical protein